ARPPRPASGTVDPEARKGETRAREQPRVPRRRQCRDLGWSLPVPLAPGSPDLGERASGDQEMRKGDWIAAALTLAFVGFGVTAFQKTLTPYLSFDEAKKARGVVQVMGGLDKTSDRYDSGKEELFFELLDADGRRMPVVYR